MVDVLPSAPVSNKCGRIFLLEVVGECTTIFFTLTGNLGPTRPVQVQKTNKRLESGNCLMDCSLAELQFFGNSVSQCLTSCNVRIFDLSTTDNCFFCPCFQHQNFAITLIILVCKTTRSLKSSFLNVVIEASVM